MKVTCGYCNQDAVYTNSSVVYGKNYGMIYFCKPCKAFVGVHEGTDKPLGTLAKDELRQLRKVCHTLFDPLWKSKKMTRHEMYHWLAESMTVTKDKAHIGMMDEAQCKNLIYKIMKAFY